MNCAPLLLLNRYTAAHLVAPTVTATATGCVNPFARHSIPPTIRIEGTSIEDEVVHSIFTWHQLKWFTREPLQPPCGAETSYSKHGAVTEGELGTNREPRRHGGKYSLTRSLSHPHSLTDQISSPKRLSAKEQGCGGSAPPEA